MDYLKLVVLVITGTIIISKYQEYIRRIQKQDVKERKPSISNKTTNQIKDSYKSDKLINKTSITVFGLLTINAFFLYNKFGINNIFCIYYFLMYLLLAISIEDLRSQKINNYIIAIGVACGFTAVFYNSQLSIADSLIGGITAGGILSVISVLSKGALGMADAKVFAMIGIFFGFSFTVSVLFLSTLSIGIFSIILLGLKKATRKTTLPFAPFIYASTLLVVILYI